ncbi:hypothetical protein ACQUW5_15100 [Legionella sp. CNM-1927-20]|uniref:hypothetical protein n=1 Tax=Legionella sp. CNM-1927-20 TaxID=3422221 RepID=UPI00403AFE39
MTLVEWNSPKNKPDALIAWLSKNSIANGSQFPITINNFFKTTVDNFFLPELHCLVEFFKFNIEIDTSLRNDLIINSLKELIIAKKESSDNLLNLIIDKLQCISLIKENRYFLTSISVAKIPFRSIQIFNSKISFYKKFPDIFKSRKVLLARNHQEETTTYTKCVVKTPTISNEINEHIDNLDIFRALINIYVNSRWHMNFDGRRDPINKVRLGQYYTLHRSDGQTIGQSYYEPKFIAAPLFNLDVISKKR